MREFMLTDKKYDEYNRRHRQMMGVTAKQIFELKVNEDAERFEFTPTKNGFTSYTVGFDETKDEETAWAIIEKAINE